MGLDPPLHQQEPLHICSVLQLCCVRGEASLSSPAWTILPFKGPSYPSLPGEPRMSVMTRNAPWWDI